MPIAWKHLSEYNHTYLRIFIIIIVNFYYVFDLLSRFPFLPVVDRKPKFILFLFWPLGITSQGDNWHAQQQAVLNHSIQHLCELFTDGCSIA